MINEDYIKEIIDSCNITDFSHDDNGVVRSEHLPEYIDSKIDEILNLSKQSSEKTLQEKCIYELKIVSTDKNAENLLLLFNLTISVFNFLNNKYYTESQQNKILASLVASSIYQYQAILVSYLSGGYLSILSLVRILYENYVSFMYLRKNKDLFQEFQDHAEMVRIKIIKEFSDAIPEEDETLLSNLNEKYGSDFSEDYGWTKKLIKKKENRKLITMVNECSLKGYSSLYKISCNYIHPSSYSILNGNDKENPLVYQFIASSVEIVTNHIIHYMRDINCQEKDRILIMNVLYGLREVLYGEPPFEL